MDGSWIWECDRIRLPFAAHVRRYDFPWSPTKLIPFYGGPEYHDYHHLIGGRSQSNFASIFTYCDWLYGTDKVSSMLSLVGINFEFHPFWKGEIFLSVGFNFDFVAFLENGNFWVLQIHCHVSEMALLLHAFEGRR